MRTPVIHVGSQLFGTFWNGAQFRLFDKQRGSCATVPLKSPGRALWKNINKIRFTDVDGRNVGNELNRLSRRFRIYTPNGPIGGRGCTEQANKKQVVTEHFRGSGWHKYIQKRFKQGGIEALVMSVSYISWEVLSWSPLSPRRESSITRSLSLLVSLPGRQVGLRPADEAGLG
jgi:hypothetical protein